MRFTLSSEHHDFFKDHGYIGFQDLFPKEVIEALESHVSGTKRDLWRSLPPVKNIVFDKGLARIAGELTRNKIIRIGFDQVIVTEDPPLFSDKITTLEKLSSIQPLACGLILRLTEGPSFSPSIPFCPRESKGTVFFFSSNMLLSFLPLFEEKNQKFLLIGYAKEKPLYLANKKDPSIHLLKKLGYGFGDHLKSATHPVLFSQRA